MTKLRLSFPSLMASIITTPADAEYHKQVNKARRELRAHISNKIRCAPLMLQLAWHHASTYDAKKKTGGPNGPIGKVPLELQEALDLCEKVKVKYPKLSYADIYQLAGVVAVEVTGGPTIDFAPGRQDAGESPSEGRLPDASQGAVQLREVFHHMGLTDKDIVALYRGYTWAKARPERSDNTLKFDNSYFAKLWESKNSSMNPTTAADKALVDDPVFRKFVEKYAKDEDAFFSDYAASHRKLSELGFNKHVNMIAHGFIGIFIASTMVMLGYIFEVNRRSK